MLKGCRSLPLAVLWALATEGEIFERDHVSDSFDPLSMDRR